MKTLKQLFNLENKVAVITGGAGHLGTAISEALAEQGATVYIASRDKDKCQKLAKKLEDKFEIKAVGKSLDLLDKSSIDDCFSEIGKAESRIDILINNASAGISVPIEQMTESEWEKGLNGTVGGVFKATMAAFPFMKMNSASIINISSMYGMISPDFSIYGETGLDNPANYGAGKAAIIQLNKYLACKFSKYSIRSNCISPGPFPTTEIQDKFPEFIKELSKKNPLGRIGTPEEIKGAIAYLSSDASKYVTGSNLVVDGGWTTW